MESRALCPFHIDSMLRKLIAKIRDTIAPKSPTAKKSSAPAPAKPARSQDRPNDSRPRQGNRSQEPRGDRRDGGQSGGRGGRGPSQGPRSPDSRPSGEGRSHGESSPRSQGDSRPARSSHDRPLHGRSSRGGSDRHGGPAERQKPVIDKDYDGPKRGPDKPIVPVDVPKMDTAFSALGLSDALAYGVQEMGYTEPTPIQKGAIPIILAGGDVIGSAQTGTGKTAAFALPIIQRLGTHGALRCLILEPTRELALQVEEAFQKFARFTDLRVTIVYGGVGYGKQVEDLRRGMDILAATPGRLLDHLEQGNCSLDKIDILVLDEVDRMLDMGFLPDVKRIVQKCAANRQTLFFTATVPPEIAQLASWALKDPVKVEIGRQRTVASTIAHGFYPVVASQKFDLLQLLLKNTDFKSVIIFSRTRMGADRIARRLEQTGHTVGVLHSDRSQRERVEALDGFKTGK